jgi:hypothetical protein
LVMFYKRVFIKINIIFHKIIILYNINIYKNYE